ncbi:hypothetical protein DF185_19915 [Marinifilum breve]|uniref:Uncharacterized protein n=1 Tax=Marinifilum breve TaxID=2184082 RepID=A0A2V3ZT70_9BACT|nr:DUF6712 family protein [Marinifilum breve]PXX96909.1 hypothetical protein DF185_19915 [Marinifilum breve]
MLVKNVSEIKQFVVVTGADINTVNPHLRQADKSYLKKLMGTEQFNELQAFCDDVPDPIPAEKKHLVGLLELAQCAEVNLGYFLYWPHMIIDVGDGGANRNESGDKKSAYSSDKERARMKFQYDGFNALEEMMEYLFDNLDKFPLFANSDAYKVATQYIITRTEEFNAIQPIGHSYLVFRNIQPFMGIVEDLQLSPKLGAEFLQELKAEMKKADSDAKYKEPIQLLKKAFAFMSYAEAADDLGIKINDKGLVFESSKDYSGNNLPSQEPLPDGKIYSAVDRARSRGESYLSDLKDYLYKKAADFPTYQSSEVYQEKTPAWGFDNTNKKTCRV